jgi:hypothetical protein
MRNWFIILSLSPWLAGTTVKCTGSYFVPIPLMSKLFVKSIAKLLPRSPRRREEEVPEEVQKVPSSAFKIMPTTIPTPALGVQAHSQIGRSLPWTNLLTEMITESRYIDHKDKSLLLPRIAHHPVEEMQTPRYNANLPSMCPHRRK